MKGQLGQALWIVFGIIGLVIAASVYTTSVGNFTGLSLTVTTYIIPIAALGVLAGVAMAYGLFKG